MVVSLNEVPLWADILDKNNLKPWFEKIATFFMSLMLISSFFILYGIRFAGSIHCIPEAGFARNLTTQDIAYVNGVCYNEWNSVLQYSDVVVFCCFAAFFMTRSWWLLTPQVVHCFNTVTQLDQSLRKLGLDLENLKKLITGPIKKETPEKKVVVRCARECLFPSNSKTWFSIAALYSLRNLSVILCSAASNFVIVRFLMIPAFTGVDFDCFPKLFANTAYSTFTCTERISKLVQIHLIVFCACAGIQALIAVVCIALINSGCFGCKEKFDIDFYADDGNGHVIEPTDGFKNAMRNMLFITVFSQHSQLLCEATNTLLQTDVRHWLKGVRKDKIDHPADEELRKLHGKMITNLRPPGPNLNQP